MVYYNEFDPKKAAWLRELIKRGLIAPGDVDERSIALVQPGDLRGYAQCHFFAGIGVWSHALRCAGWADERPVWTASCPCQPFSAAGKQKGFGDERHLWPELFRLIAECSPVCVLGEQVAKRNGLAWLDAVCDDLEGSGYAVGAVVAPACGFGAPQIRERLYWMANRLSAGLEERGCERRDDGAELATAERGGEAGRLAYVSIVGCERRRAGEAGGRQEQSERLCDAGGLECAAGDGWQQRRPEPDGGSAAGGCGAGGVGGVSARRCAGGSLSVQQGQERERDCVDAGGPGAVNGFWAGADWVLTRPQRLGDPPSLRPVEPGSFPLVDGAPARVGRLRGYGDAIVAPQATEFIKAVMEILQ